MPAGVRLQAETLVRSGKPGGLVQKSLVFRTVRRTSGNPHECWAEEGVFGPGFLSPAAEVPWPPAGGRWVWYRARTREPMSRQPWSGPGVGPVSSFSAVEAGAHGETGRIEPARR